MSQFIVVVDDDLKLAELVARHLETRGYLAQAVSTGREALALMRERNVDLVITDVNMPDMDGIEVLAAVKELSDVPVVVFSAGGLMDKSLLLGNASMLGASATLEKPVDLSELGEVVDNLVGRV